MIPITPDYPGKERGTVVSHPLHGETVERVGGHEPQPPVSGIDFWIIPTAARRVAAERPGRGEQPRISERSRWILLGLNEKETGGVGLAKSA